LACICAGKTTLETYLLQHHIWLTSNAKTLLTIVPDHPWINFALASMLFMVVSKELYRITMSLRYVACNIRYSCCALFLNSLNAFLASVQLTPLAVVQHLF
jgi:hypothetical protein